MRRQKIVIKVQMKSEKCRIKVMKIISEAHGVISLTIQGPDRDRVVVIGSGIDSVKLTISLRKNVGHATIESVQNLNDNNTQEDDEDNTYSHASSSYWGSTSTSSRYPQPQRPVYYYNVVQDPYQGSNCSIV